MQVARHGHGFTMIELIMVIIVVGILSAMALPRLSTRGFDESGFRDAVVATLDYARKAAVAQRRKVQVTLTGNTLSFRIANNVPEDPAAAVFTGASARDLDVPGGSAAQISPRGATTLSGPATLVFDPLGRVSAASYVYTITGDAARTLTVDAATGYVY